MVTSEQAKIIVEAFRIRDIVEDEEEMLLLDFETIMAFSAIVELAGSGE